jgi:sugar (pentulose or hexulose) kinase
VGYNFLAGEPIAGVAKGAPVIARAPGGKLTLANFMKMQVYSALGSLAMGCEILAKEKVAIDSVCGHGGFFKSPFVGQSAMSAAVGAPVTVMSNAGEGGAWGIAVLALYRYLGGSNLEKFLEKVFENAEKSTVSADKNEIEAFGAFMVKYKKCLAAQKLMSEEL